MLMWSDRRPALLRGRDAALPGPVAGRAPGGAPSPETSGACLTARSPCPRGGAGRSGIFDHRCIDGTGSGLVRDAPGHRPLLPAPRRGLDPSFRGSL